MQQELRNTPLVEWHTARGATMVDFGGWSMPLWYPSGARSEHLAVIIAAGLFDTSHMAVVMVEGADALNLLQRCFTKDLRACVGKGRAPLSPGKCVYGAYLNERGEVIDDAIIYHLKSDSYMTVVNCGMDGRIKEHLAANSEEFDAALTDLTGQLGKIDVQGPNAARILKKVLKEPDVVLQDIAYFTFKGHFSTESPSADVLLSDNTAVLLSRTGYTGEFGFEIFVDAGRLVRAWEMIMQAGKEYDLICCGLAARDSLRAGAVLPLSHQDIGPWPFINHPWPFALPFDQDQTAFTKNFIGDVILDLREKAEHTHAFVGFDPRKVSIRDPALVLDSEGREIGLVLTCVADLAIGRVNGRIYSIGSADRPVGFKPHGLCCGFVRVKSKLAQGRRVVLKDSRRKIEVEIVDDVRPDRSARRAIREFI